jgi:hypothetical protein
MMVFVALLAFNQLPPEYVFNLFLLLLLLLFSSWQAAAGYRVSFPNTATDVLGMADTYGGVRVRVDRELMKDMKASFFLHYNAGATGQGKDADDPNSFGIKVTIGKQPTFDPPLSPCTMNRVQFRIQ